MEKFYITTPVYYANSNPHIGHAYTTIKADVLARWNRFQGKDVFFSVGTDEFGLKIQKRAEELGKDPQEFVDEISDLFRELWKHLNISFDNFIRTTKPEHKEVVKKVFNNLYKKGAIYKGVYKGLYCVGCEQFVTESQLVDGKCPDHDKEPQVIEEESYLMKLSNVQNDLIKKIESDELKIVPQTRKNEILSFLQRNKLEDISVSRDINKLKWEIQLPFDEKHVAYVWVDAFLNYLSVLGWDGNPNNVPKYFPPEVQLVAKDILRVHATIWPAILMHLGLPLPKQIYVHGFILSEGRKMSKTIGNVVDPLKLIEEYGTDALRYYLMREITSFGDGDITIDRFKEVYNANLANGLGNLVNRVMKMSELYLDNPVEITAESKSIFSEKVKKYKEHMNSFDLDKAMDVIWEVISGLDVHIQETQPFKVVKENKERAQEIVKYLVGGVNQVAEMLEPIMPDTANKISEAIQKNKMPEALFLRKE